MVVSGHFADDHSPSCEDVSRLLSPDVRKLAERAKVAETVLGVQEVVEHVNPSKHHELVDVGVAVRLDHPY